MAEFRAVTIVSNSAEAEVDARQSKASFLPISWYGYRGQVSSAEVNGRFSQRPSNSTTIS